MALLDIISQAAGSAAIEQVGARVGLTPAQSRAAAAALLPALAGGLKRQSGNSDLGGLLAGLSPATAAGAAPDLGNQILGQVFGSKDVSRTVAANAATSTGIGVDQLKALLPLLASLSAGALAAPRAGAAPAAQGGLAGMLSLLDQDGDGDPLNDILGMAGKLLRR
ncbi:DUF937 domain-containing protein [Phenylobacterium sp.]|uniref:DUF937 domain-containing protein n=1 Tax=Phenylobacterium sp. TaxID=1871053 RepID=UPI00301C2583